ncbi:MAG: hypothetical protein HFG23_08365 [Anaerotruncus sp.]|nr:hypothetical protein [Anaerotruncus sp.]
MVSKKYPDHLISSALCFCRSYFDVGVQRMEPNVQSGHISIGEHGGGRARLGIACVALAVGCNRNIVPSEKGKKAGWEPV